MVLLQKLNKSIAVEFLDQRKAPLGQQKKFFFELQKIHKQVLQSIVDL